MIHNCVFRLKTMFEHVLIIIIVLNLRVHFQKYLKISFSLSRQCAFIWVRWAVSSGTWVQHLSGELNEKKHEL